MIVDAHTHIFPDPIAPGVIKKLQGDSKVAAYTQATGSSLVASMDRAGIDLSLNLPAATNPLKVRKINELSAMRNHCQKRIFSIGCIHPDCADVRAELERVRELGLKAVKLHPYFQHHDFDDPAYLRLMNIAGELDLIVVAHTGTDMGFPGQYRCTTRMIANVLRQVKGVKLVLAHMGGCGNWEDIMPAIDSSCVYLDCAYSMGLVLDREGNPVPDAPRLLAAEEFLQMVDSFGCERILFGSDSPWMDQGNSLALVDELPLDACAKARIMGENALELFGLRDWIKE